jgi:hypothetical protein
MQKASQEEGLLFPLLTLQSGIVRIRAELDWMQETLEKLQQE